LAAVADLYPEIVKLGADVVAISSDSVFSHKVFHDISPSAQKVQYPLLSDRDGSISKAYGVWDASGMPYRATFIIDPESCIRSYSVYPEGVGRNIPEILRTLQGLQFGVQTGQGVPSGWMPGMQGVSSDIQNAGRI
jgi:peroxiredoxin (alkyl hydroperoxide reductase subunit C)